MRKARPFFAACVPSVNGTIDIDVANGATFGLSDITGFDLRRTGTSESSLDTLGESLPILAFAAGTVSADGMTAMFTDFGTIFNAGDPRGSFGSFGCAQENCANGIVTLGLGPLGTRAYGSAGAALASFSATAAPTVPDTTPVPLPAGIVLLLTGLAGMAALKRRRKSVGQVLAPSF